jgi:hypothetical protein
MRDIVRIGQRYRRRGNGVVITVVNVHRADRSVTAETVDPPARFEVAFRDLGKRWDLLQPLDEVAA